MKTQEHEIKSIRLELNATKYQYNEVKVAYEELSKRIKTKEEYITLKDEEVKEKEAKLEKALRELEVIHSKKTANEAVLKKALTKTKERERELHTKNEELKAREEEISAINERLLENEKVLKEKENSLKQSNEELKAAEEELRQNMEELSTINESLEVKRIELERLSESQKEALRKVRQKEVELTEKNEELEARGEEMKAQKEAIEENMNLLDAQNRHIMGSLNYARTIQSSILPTTNELASLFPDHFVTYHPKDIVSGDFYWCYEKAPYVYFAVVDCTGHGVPGAFMSMMGYSLLNEIVAENEGILPSEVLTSLNRKIRSSLNQDKEDKNTDGMDLGLIRLKKSSEDIVEVIFSGARRPLLYFDRKADELVKIAGNRKSIGGGNTAADEQSFSDVSLQIASGTCLYLYSDGFTDQCDTARKKLGTRNLYAFLSRINREEVSFEEQKSLVPDLLDEHQGEVKQRDDITFVGIKL
ncbi:MAG: SpoIIE family protein phosphatase [Thermonemataceae bacterium]